MDTSPCPACPAGPINSQPDTVAHTEWHGDEPNHAPCVSAGLWCQPLLPWVEFSKEPGGCYWRETDRGTGRVMKDAKRVSWMGEWWWEREWHMAPLTALFSTTLSFFYVPTCQSFSFLDFCSLSVLNVSLSLPFIIQYDWSVFFIQVKILLSKPGVGNFGFGWLIMPKVMVHFLDFFLWENVWQARTQSFSWNCVLCWVGGAQLLVGGWGEVTWSQKGVVWRCLWLLCGLNDLFLDTFHGLECLCVHSDVEHVQSSLPPMFVDLICMLTLKPNIQR